MSDCLFAGSRFRNQEYSAEKRYPERDCTKTRQGNGKGKAFFFGGERETFLVFFLSGFRSIQATFQFCGENRADDRICSNDAFRHGAQDRCRIGLQGKDGNDAKRQAQISEQRGASELIFRMSVNLSFCMRISRTMAAA